MDSVVKVHGLPSNFVSDKDPILMCKFGRELFALQGVPSHFSTAKLIVWGGKPVPTNLSQVHDFIST